MTELKQIEEWIHKGQFEEIISALEHIPKGELEYHDLRSLGLAYNNTGRLDDAIQVLKSISDIG